MYLAIFMIVAVSEFVFWGEFSSRFDFIAVDYLLYTHEVIGNIRQSYPVGLWSGTVLVICVVISWFGYRRFSGTAPASLIRRVAYLAAISIGVVVSFGLVDVQIAKKTDNFFVQQLSLNGLFALGHAYRHNQLDYAQYYPVNADDELNTQVRKLLIQSNTTFNGSDGIERDVKSYVPAKDVNVVLISVESLSADFLAHFGNTQNITPELDRLADQGLLFSNLYATGTRTVRGLEALSIGTPPTPGQSIVRRPHNTGLENIGEELNESGWQSYWMCGGYGFFDNMNAYFESNDYKVIDRSDAEKEGIEIHAENIWGIADEDLFSLALKKLDQSHEKDSRFFAHIMTTSNHRPYTFPDDRIDLPQGRRESAVKYTDWAIGDFIRRSKTKPWFNTTLFVIIADHTAKASGKTDLPPSRYHIPMIWYAPGLIEHGVMDRLMSQIDVPTTLMGWLGLNYTSRFYGYDMAVLEPGRERAFISTYQKLGYLKDDRLVILDINQPATVLPGLPKKAGSPESLSDEQLIDEAISFYQSASQNFTAGLLKDAASDGDDNTSERKN